MSALARDAAFAARLRAFDSATVYEANGRVGAMEPGIVPQLAGQRVAGRARTVLCSPRDNLALHHAVAAAEPGDVLVANALDARIGMWGEVLTIAAQARGVAGLVIDGAVRDIDAIRALGFPIFSRALAIAGATKDVPGELDQPIACGGQLVRRGDWVLADDSGVAVLPDDRVEAALAAAEARIDGETRVIEGLRGGQTTVELLGLAPLPTTNTTMETPA
ncbi:RraA family protein [Conexibacter woesei]|uniref:Putative 4-hydroxy-4-methyl-2-oxoglutarate aldolase n=1 Tax=Conexibacter woesei (strain DSM 14684 / CCUG 47730 / CIP 108061 / JCM 11494 / NBRC 100937 / ID131577) TaxID=469383 RepID=D3FCC0_CONWI|nr:RraA family protein [Conexibacter woesei]ADB53415.1 Dimethylmenaquinone methyltransferase [Conexibacter woesei DSM 14684]